MGKDEDQLMEAVRCGDVASLQKIINKHKNKKLINPAKKLNLNRQDSNGLSLLHEASLVGNTEIMKLLLQNGAQVDIKDLKGMQPLHYAAWRGYEAPVDLLIEHGSVINETSYDGNMALHFASEYGHAQVVDLLLHHNANPTLVNSQHKTALDLASEFGRVRVVELLLECDSCRHLLNDCSKDMLDNERSTCLHLAAKNGHLEIIRLLLDAGMDINRQTLQGTCLHEAAKYGKTDAVRLLLSCGVDVSRLNSYEQTALEIVKKFTTTKGAKEMKQMLQDASVNACREGEVRMSQRLMAKELRNERRPNSSPSQTNPMDLTHFGGTIGIDRMFPPPPPSTLAAKVTSQSEGQDVCHNGWNGYHSTSAVDDVIVSTRDGATSNGRTSTTNPSGIGTAGYSLIGVGQLNRLSGQSLESGVSSSSNGGRNSYHSNTSSHSNGSNGHLSNAGSSGSSQGSLNQLEESGYSSTVNVHQLMQQGLSNVDVLHTWLSSVRLEECLHFFSEAGYDMPTITRMTPEDLTAIGITRPSVRKKLKSEITKLTISDGIPDFKPRDVVEWLNALNLVEYVDTLIKEGYNEIDKITDITWEDLEEIGIKKLGHQKKIMLAIDRLKRINSSSNRLSSASQSSLDDSPPPPPLPPPLHPTYNYHPAHHLAAHPNSLQPSSSYVNHDERRVDVGHVDRGVNCAMTDVNHQLHLPPQCHPPPPPRSSTATNPNPLNGYSVAVNQQQVVAETLNADGRAPARGIESDGDATPTNERKATSSDGRGGNSVARQPVAKVVAVTIRNNGRTDEEKNSKEEFNSSAAAALCRDVTTLPRKTSCKRKIGGFDGPNVPHYTGLPYETNHDVTQPDSNPGFLYVNDAGQSEATSGFVYNSVGQSLGYRSNYPIDQSNVAVNNSAQSGAFAYNQSDAAKHFSYSSNESQSEAVPGYAYDNNNQSGGGAWEETTDKYSFNDWNARKMMSHLKRNPPPPPPKRTNSFKTDVNSLFGIAGEKLRSEKRSTNPNSNPINSTNNSQFANDVALLAVEDPHGSSRPTASHRVKEGHDDPCWPSVGHGTREGHEDPHSRPSSVGQRISEKHQPSKVVAKQNEVSPTSSKVKSGVWHDDVVGGGCDSSGDDSDSGLESRRSVSTVSLESNGSGSGVDSNTLPFANENVGTIKQRQPSMKPSILTSTDGDSRRLDVDLFDNGAASTTTLSRSGNKTLSRDNNVQRGFTKEFNNTEFMDDTNVNADSVFNDIDGMLMGLTQELDEMLKLQS